MLRMDPAESRKSHVTPGTEAAAAAVPVATVTENSGRYIHPEAASLFATCSWLRRVPIFGEAVEGYGPKVIVALAGCYFMCKGIADQILYGQTYAMRRVPIFGEAVEGYGPKVIVALAGCYFMCKGIADQILYGQTYAM
ncbi:hypothetical protein IOCL2690_000046600, partial [Leishmania lindenbergi]